MRVYAGQRDVKSWHTPWKNGSVQKPGPVVPHNLQSVGFIFSSGESEEEVGGGTTQVYFPRADSTFP